MLIGIASAGDELRKARVLARSNEILIRLDMSESPELLFVGRTGLGRTRNRLTHVPCPTNESPPVSLGEAMIPAVRDRSVV